MVKKKDTMLKEVELFSDLKPDYLRLLAESCVERSFETGDVIIEQGAKGIGLMMIIEGRVRVTKRRVSGADLEVATMGPGELRANGRAAERWPPSVG